MVDFSSNNEVAATTKCQQHHEQLEVHQQNLKSHKQKIRNVQQQQYPETTLKSWGGFRPKIVFVGWLKPTAVDKNMGDSGNIMSNMGIPGLVNCNYGKTITML